MLVAKQLFPRHESGRNLEIFSKPPNEDIDTWGAVIRGECLEIRPRVGVRVKTTQRRLPRKSVTESLLRKLPASLTLDQFYQHFVMRPLILPICTLSHICEVATNEVGQANTITYLPFPLALI